MFDDGVLAHDFHGEHFEHALGDFFPIGDCADVVQHGRRFSEWDSLFDALDKVHAAKIHISISLAERALVMYRLWCVTIRVAY